MTNKTPEQRVRAMLAQYSSGDCSYHEGSSMEADMITMVREAEANALRRCMDAQPPTAENPKESNYQNGYFDGVMAYANAIRSLLPKEEGK